MQFTAEANAGKANVACEPFNLAKVAESCFIVHNIWCSDQAMAAKWSTAGSIGQICQPQGKMCSLHLFRKTVGKATVMDLSKISLNFLNWKFASLGIFWFSHHHCSQAKQHANTRVMWYQTNMRCTVFAAEKLLPARYVHRNVARSVSRWPTIVGTHKVRRVSICEVPRFGSK